VSMPLPAPTSTTSSPARTPASRTIAAARALLRRRCRPPGRPCWTRAERTDHHHCHDAGQPTSGSQPSR
jgi:hypothetical protein